MGILSFFDRFRASSDDRSPWGDFWFEPVSIRSSSGIRVSPDGSLRLSAVYACVRILSETMASLPLVLYRNRADGGKDRVTDHWLHNLLCRRPNRYQNPFEWREMLQGHLALRGNAYNQIITNPRGEIVELIPIHPDRVKVEVLTTGEYRYRVTDRAGTETILPRGAVWHLRGLGSDELTEWMAYYQLEPFGDYRADYRSGVVASTFANAHRAKDANPFRPEDFMPFLEKKKPQEEIPLNVARFKAMFSHKVVKHG